MLFNKKGSLDKKFLADILDTFYESTHIPIKYIDAGGKTLMTRGKEHLFCNNFHNFIEERSNCDQTHLYTSQQAYRFGEIYIFFCPIGLTEFSYPIIYEGKFCGALIGGPVTMITPDELMLEEIFNKTNISSDHKEKVEFYLKKVPLISPKRVRYLGNLIEIMAKEITQENHIELKEHHANMLQQSEISETMHSIKCLDKINSQYPYEKEKDMFIKIKNGDIEGAKTILNELLAYIFYHTGSSLEESKIRTLEISSLLSRVAIDGGAELSRIFKMNYQFINKLHKIKNIEELSACLLRVLDRFSENVIKLNDFKNSNKIKYAIQFINSNYMEDLSLQRVSDRIGLSPKYFSSLFKKKTEKSFIEYVNQVRIEESKRLLILTDRTILDIALSVGYEDVSYFSKIFKKITTLSPNQYRKLNS